MQDALRRDELVRELLYIARPPADDDHLEAVAVIETVANSVAAVSAKRFMRKIVLSLLSVARLIAAAQGNSNDGDLAAPS